MFGQRGVNAINIGNKLQKSSKIQFFSQLWDHGLRASWAQKKLKFWQNSSFWSWIDALVDPKFVNTCCVLIIKQQHFLSPFPFPVSKFSLSMPYPSLCPLSLPLPFICLSPTLSSLWKFPYLISWPLFLSLYLLAFGHWVQKLKRLTDARMNVQN